MIESVIKKLLGAEDGVLRGLSHAELHNLLSFDLDRFAGGRVATLASFALDEHEFAETRQGERVLRVLVSELRDDFEDRNSLLLRELSFFSDGGGDLGFGEGFGHGVMGC